MNFIKTLTYDIILFLFLSSRRKIGVRIDPNLVKIKESNQKDPTKESLKSNAILGRVLGNLESVSSTN